MSSPGNVDPAQIQQIVDEARAFVDAFEQLREQSREVGVEDWFEFRRAAIQRQWDELRGVVAHDDAERFLPVVDAIIGNAVPLEQGPPGVSVDEVSATLQALAQDRLDLVHGIIGPDRHPTPEAYRQIAAALVIITS